MESRAELCVRRAERSCVSGEQSGAVCQENRAELCVRRAERSCVLGEQSGAVC